MIRNTGDLWGSWGLPQILTGLSDDDLATWPGELADQERERSKVIC
jgi:hypothetical protein